MRLTVPNEIDEVGYPRFYFISLAVISLLAVVLRIAAAVVLNQKLDSDPLAYFTMARSLAEHGAPADNFGQHAFFSPGYPLVLAPFFVLLGSSVPVALAVNMLLSIVSVWLVALLGRSLSHRNDVSLLAALVFALWLPGIWESTLLARENLSTPLLVALALCAVHLPRSRHPAALALLTGLVWGAALMAGASALLMWAGVAVALWLLWRATGRLASAIRAGLCFAISATLILSPWLYATDRMVGRPVLTTNAAFNLYLGNNPAATGWFVSIADTPLGRNWDQVRRRLGEVGNADRLQREALAWVGSHPAETAGLAVRKLAYFWQPNVPDAADFAQSKAVAMIRLVEVAQYVAIMALGLCAFFTRSLGRRDKWIVGALIASFWAVHAAAYIVARYRDPVVPLLIVLASITIVAWVRRRSAPELARVA